MLTWLVETVLTGGSAMIDDVPFGRVRPLRPRVTRQIKATIGGTVTTALISPTTIPGPLDVGHRRQDRRATPPGAARRDAAPLGRRSRTPTRPTRLAALLVTGRHSTRPIAQLRRLVAARASPSERVSRAGVGGHHRGDVVRSVTPACRHGYEPLCRSRLMRAQRREGRDAGSSEEGDLADLGAEG